MTKTEFLESLRKQVSEYPAEETERSLDYYSEMIDDCMEDGMSESEAVASLGKIEEIARQIKEELPLTTLVKRKTREKTKGKTLPVWAILLLALGSPVWLGVGLSIVAIVLSLYVGIWAILLGVWCVWLGIAAAGIGGVVGCVVSLLHGAVGSACVYFGTGLCGAGLCIFLFQGLLLLSKGLCHGTGWCFRQMKKALIE